MLKLKSFSFLFIALFGLLLGYLARQYYSHFYSHSSFLTDSQKQLLAEMGLDGYRLQLLKDGISASRLFAANAVDRIADSLVELMESQREFLGKVGAVSMSYKEQFSAVMRVCSESFPQQVARIRTLLRSYSASTTAEQALNPGDAWNELKKFITENPKGKAVRTWVYGVASEYGHLMRMAATALPKKIVEWCEKMIEQMHE